MTTSRRVFGAFLVTAIAAFPGAALAAPANKKVDALACKGSVCRLAVKVEGDCGITVEPEWLFVSGKNVRLVWEILPAGYHFHPVEGIRFKDEFNPAWRTEFFEVGKGEGGGDVILSQAARPSGPSRASTWGDLNTRPGVFRYSVTVINSRTNQECRSDPGVVNDWDSEPTPP